MRLCMEKRLLRLDNLDISIWIWNMQAFWMSWVIREVENGKVGGNIGDGNMEIVSKSDESDGKTV